MEVKRPFFCDVCGEGFTSKTYVDRHQAVHSSSKNFQCELCSCRYKYKKGLNRHMKKWHRKLHSKNPSLPPNPASPDTNNPTSLKLTDKQQSDIIQFQAMQLERFRNAGLSFFMTPAFSTFTFF